MSQIQSKWNQMEQRAIKLLGSGTPGTAVAQACGVSESRISQLMSMDDFKEEVNGLKFQNLQKHNDLDSMYDDMETQVAKSLKEMIPLIMRPGDLLKAAQVLNTMKRKGNSASEQVATQSTVVNLLMPISVVQKFTTNVNNQVIHANGQTLETIQGRSLLDAAKNKAESLSNQRKDYVIESEVSSSARPMQPQLPETISAASLQSKSIGTATVFKQAVSPDGN